MAMKKVAKTALGWCGAGSSPVQVSSKACLRAGRYLQFAVRSLDAGPVNRGLARAIKRRHLGVSAENARPGAAVSGGVGAGREKGVPPETQVSARLIYSTCRSMCVCA